MKKICIIILLCFAVCLTSCGKEPDNLTIDLGSLSLKNFTVSVNGIEYEGLLSYSTDNSMEISIKEPKELSGFKFVINKNGITCLDDGVKCEYGFADFINNFIFFDLFNLISCSLTDCGLTKKHDGYIFEIDNNSITFDNDGIITNAQINGTKIYFS